ncbi:hypothetical protein [Nonomuraea sp. NPDC050310]|uniref:hypothetical protein n=1 Tax=unclassified Nonomuraea TaxID=2593643 RepID=UPI0033D98DF1
MVTGAAFATDECKPGRAALLQAPTTVVSLCEDVTDVRAAGTYGGKMSAPANSPVFRTAEVLAQRAGLPGLARSSAVLSVADLGGVAAGAGAPALPSEVPTSLANAARVPSGLADVSQLAEFPDVPGLPGNPGERLPEAARMVPQLPDLAETTGADKLPERVAEVEDKVAPLLPEQAPGLVQSLPLTEQAAVEDLAELLENLELD